MKKITLALAALVAFGGVANAEAAKKLICKANFDAAAVALNQPHYLGVNDVNKLQMTNEINDRSTWTITENGDGSYYIKNVEMDAYLYIEDGADRMITDDQTKVYVVNSTAIKDAVGFTTTAGATTNQNVFLNISGSNGMITGWNLDRGSSFFIMDYVEGDTDESVQVRVQGKLMKDRMEAYLNSSSFGKRNKEGFLSQLDKVSTEAELDATVENITNIAIGGVITDLEEGAKIINNKNSKLMKYNAEAANGRVVEMTDQFVGSAFWTAEITNGVLGFTVAPADAKIRIKNTASGLYMGKPAANNEALKMVAEDSEDIAEYLIVAGDNGLEFRCTNAVSDKDYLNCAGNAYVCTWQAHNDENAYWSVETLEQFSHEDIIVDFIGEGEDSEFGEFTSIDKIVVKVRKDAQLSIGSIKLYYYDEAENVESLIDQPISEYLAGVTPTAETITIEAFDPNVGDYVEREVEMNVYEVALENALTTPNDYHVELTVGAFITVIDGKDVYSPEAAGTGYIAAPSFEVTVTPEAGNVKEITTITIGSTEGVAANPTFAGFENLNVTKTVMTVEEDPEMGPIYIPNETTLLDIDQEKIGEYATDGSNDIYFELPLNVTEAEPGDYKLTVPQGFFTSDQGAECEFMTVTWTIEDVTGINTITNVKVNGNTIFDLQGRKLAAPAKGINIINGKKVIVK